MANIRFKRRRFLQAGTAGLSFLAIPGIGRVRAKPANEFHRGSYEGRICYNENPLGPSPLALEAMTAAAADANRYPDWYNDALETKIGLSHDLPKNAICVGNGATEIIRLIADAFLGPGDEMITATPTYFQMASEAVQNGAAVVNVPLDITYTIDLNAIYDAITPETKLISLVNPNNPLATPVHRSDMLDFITSLPEGIIVVVDEAYHHYVQTRTYESCIPYVLEGLPVIVVRTFSKVYGLAGARIGYAAAPPQYLSQIASSQLFGTVSNVSQAAALAALDDKEHLKNTLATNTISKRILREGFTSLGLETIPSETNFMMVDTGMSAGAVASALLARGFQIRFGWGMPQYIRVSTGLPDEMKGFIAALGEIIPDIYHHDPAPGFGIHSALPDKRGTRTMIRFSATGTERLNLTVLDTSGRKIMTLVNGPIHPGVHELAWDGTTFHGKSVGPGHYVVILRQGEWVDFARFSFV